MPIKYENIIKNEEWDFGVHRIGDQLDCHLCNYSAQTNKVVFNMYCDRVSQDTNMRAHLKTYKHYLNKTEYEREIESENKKDEYVNSFNKMYNEMKTLKA